MANIAMMMFSNTTNDAGEYVLSCYYESMVKGLEEAGNSVLVITHPYFGEWESSKAHCLSRMYLQMNMISFNSEGIAYEKNKEVSDCRGRRVWRNCI